ncbi:hypothetical protein BGZ94_008198 [Podila epigama]|nr:hypothetical protein BGZ94_008198 [Podila epigama]
MHFTKNITVLALAITALVAVVQASPINNVEIEKRDWGCPSSPIPCRHNCLVNFGLPNGYCFGDMCRCT